LASTGFGTSSDRAANGARRRQDVAANANSLI
jgi:hypothetical protein